MLRTAISPLHRVKRASSVFNGPGLEDFLKGEVEEKSYKEYAGKLKRERGDKRLPLPPWLKGKKKLRIAGHLFIHYIYGIE